MFVSILFTIIISALLPACITFVFTIMQIQRAKGDSREKVSDDNFTVMLPSMFMAVGAMGIIAALAVMLGFTFFSDEIPHPVFYVVFGLLLWLGIYLVVKTLTFRVIVKGKEITVFSALRKPYSFTFDDVVSAVRQVKKNRVESERIVIRTVSGRRLIVESAEISYKRFAKRIQLEVDKERLTGFE